MSLLTSVLARQGLQKLGVGRGVFFRPVNIAQSTSKWVTTSSCLRSEVLKPEEDFWDKNKRLDRPMSPHLTIYKFQITSILSITHRGTGLALSGLMSGLGIGMLILPGSFPYYLGLVQSLAVGPALIVSAKFLLAWPFVFHFTNGIRHLCWDLGKGFQIKEVYATGWTVVGISTLLALGLACM